MAPTTPTTSKHADALRICLHDILSSRLSPDKVDELFLQRVTGNLNFLIKHITGDYDIDPSTIDLLMHYAPQSSPCPDSFQVSLIRHCPKFTRGFDVLLQGIPRSDQNFAIKSLATVADNAITEMMEARESLLDTYNETTKLATKG